LNGANLQFGVSGFLYENNLVMYDYQTESLWWQKYGQAVVGSYNLTQLPELPSEWLTLAEIKKNHPLAEVLSEDTGYVRDYSYDPYESNKK
jgi:hypothetical protein